MTSTARPRSALLHSALPFAALMALAACQPADDGGSPDEAAAAGSTAPRTANVPAAAPGGDSTRPYDGIAADETLRFTGTEPFWGGTVANGTMTYSTPENQDGETVSVARFAGRGGVSFTGTLARGDFAMAVTPAACSDGMSDRTYPFAVTLELADETRTGCGWTDRTPFTGDPSP